jgi:hypothetical protein
MLRTSFSGAVFFPRMRDIIFDLVTLSTVSISNYNQGVGSLGLFSQTK